jgi:hypothetical protein
LVTYLAQRLRPKEIEVLSDVLFIAATLDILYLALKISGLY